MIYGTSADKLFRSRGGRGFWLYCASVTSNLDTAQKLTVPKNLASNLLQKGWRGLVPSFGIRVRGTVTPAVGVTDLYCTKHQVLSHISCMIYNDFKAPYMSAREDLARLAYCGMIANARAERLDQHFSEPVNRPLRGIVAKSFCAPSTAIAGDPNTFPVLVQNASNYPCQDERDDYWRQLEQKIQVRTSGAATAGTFDLFQSLPLCVDTGGLDRDSIPLETLCDLNKPWEVSLSLDRSLVDNLCVGGAMALTRFDLYVYVIPIRDTDGRKHGLPYIIRRQNRAQSPLQYQQGEVVIFSGNLPITGQDAASYVDTVDAVAYHPGVIFGDFAGDLAQGNNLDWNVANEVARFPYYFDERGPRFVYDSVWNSRPAVHQIRYGSSTECVVRAGRDMSASVTGVANVVDAANLVNLLGPISPWPVRIVACSALEMEGFPGFGSLDAQCGTPYIDLTGSYNFNGSNNVSAFNGRGGMVDIILNNTTQDKLYIENLGANCCTDGKVTWAGTAADPGKESAGIVAAKLTTSQEVKPDAVMTGEAKSTGLPSAVDNVAGNNAPQLITNLK